MKKFTIIFLLSALTILGACTSGKKSFERGNYYEAVLKAVNRLRQNPGHKKSVETLREGYPLAVEWLETDAKNSMASDAPFKWRETVQAYEKINRMYEEILRSPGAKRVISNPKSYFTELAEAKESAAKESYDAGVAALLKDSREDAKRAYRHFQTANKYSPGYKDVNDFLREAKDKATLKVIIEQIPVPTRYTLSGGFFQDKVEEYLHNQSNRREFVRFYTPVEARNNNVERADQIIKIAFDDFVVGNTHTTQKEITVTSEDSVKVGQVVLADGKKVDAFNTVTAKLTTFHKEVISEGLLSMQVFDANSDAVLTHKKFNGKYVWFCEWGSFNGDERALSDAQKKIVNQKEVPPPQHQDLFIEFTRPIYSQLTEAVNRFYARY
ncbi:MAG: hypothetical protein AAFX87_15645 [Bacteroidota bacterium]